MTIFGRYSSLARRCIRRRSRVHALLKIDIARAFDSVVCMAILIGGFVAHGIQLANDGGREWISTLLRTASILNGRPGRRICHARGLRTPRLSPMLFVVVVMEVRPQWNDPTSRLTSKASIRLGSAALGRGCPCTRTTSSFPIFCCSKRSILAPSVRSDLFTNLDKDKCVASPLHCSEV